MDNEAFYAWAVRLKEKEESDDDNMIAWSNWIARLAIDS